MKHGMVTLLVCISVMVLSGPTHAAERFAGDFLMLGMGARAFGMGGGGAAFITGSSSAYYNPAGLAGYGTREAGFMHSEQFGGLENYNTVAVSAPISGTITGAVNIVHLGVGNIKYTRLWDPSQAISDSNRVEIASREDAADYAVYFSAGGMLREWLAVGGSVKVLRRSVGRDTAFGYGLDAGCRVFLGEQMLLSAVVRDITGTTIAWDGRANDRIAPTLDIGMAACGDVPLAGGQYIVACSLPYFGDSPDTKGIATMHLGIEYVVHDAVAFRAGSTEGQGTFGIGLLRLPLLSWTMLDYAYGSHEELDSTHRLSLTARF